jgi:HemX protein
MRHDLLDPLLLLFLTATTVLYWIAFLRGREAHLLPARVCLGVTLGLLVTRFAAFVIEMGRPPLATRGEAFTTVALSIALVFGILELFHRERSAGFLLLAFAALFEGLSFLDSPAGPEVNTVLGDPWFGVHAVAATFGYTAFAISAVYATLFVLLYTDLKRRRFGVLYEQVPSLEALSRLAIRSAFLGLAFLTIAIVVGTQAWVRVLSVPFYRDPKVVSTLVIWAIYGAGVSLHYFAGWRGIRSIGITLAAFVLMVLSSWLVPIVLGSSHGVRELL